MAIIGCGISHKNKKNIQINAAITKQKATQKQNDETRDKYFLQIL
jgi:hypothetical protein